MSLSLRNVGAITLFVEDVRRSKPFYEDVFDASLVYEDDHSAAFDFGNTLIDLLERSSAHELIEPARVAGAETGSQLQFSIAVDDVGAICSELEGRGVELLNGPIDRPWGLPCAARLGSA